MSHIAGTVPPFVSGSAYRYRVDREARHAIRIASVSDVDAIGRLLHSFNEEFGEPSPSADILADRFKAQLTPSSSWVGMDQTDSLS